MNCLYIIVLNLSFCIYHKNTNIQDLDLQAFIANLEDYAKFKEFLVANAKAQVKWRSGVKHGLSAVMGLTRNEQDYVNGLGEYVDIEFDLLFPLLKGSDIGSSKEWRNKFVLLTQKAVGMDTSYMAKLYPKTWDYLLTNAARLDSRASGIYKKNPRFTIFGVGDYSFQKWKIAICGLYKSLNFRLVAPIEDKPVMFDDIVYFISFDSQEEAEQAYVYLTSKLTQSILNALIFWDDKRPVKTSILNPLKWQANDCSQIA